MKHQKIWEDPRILELGRETMHVPLGAWSSEKKARTTKRHESPNRLSLNGTWDFKLYHSPEDVPDDFFLPSWKGKDWGTIPVPSNWQLQAGSFDKPLYSNIAMTFEPNPPFVPPENPTGCYRLSFSVPENWEEKRIFLNFESVDSAFIVWINGVELGYGQDSRLGSEFEITPHLKDGQNTIAVMVLRYSCGTYIEDQDYWQMSGIQREVFLLAKPPVYIRDYAIRTTLSNSYENAELEVDVFLSNVLAEKRSSDDFTHKGPVFKAWSTAYQSWVAEIRLYDPQGKEVLELEAPFAPHTPMYVDSSYHPLKGCARFKVPVPEAQLWSSEDPALYTVTMCLRSTEGDLLDVEASRVGFRSVEIRDRVLRVNGKRLQVRGVCRHEHNPRTGRALSTEEMRADIVAMKQLNFNAVRTSHYPNDVRWYDLCDELGLYVVDEANLECHGVGGDLTRDPAWMAFYMVRSQRMALRDRNHPSIIIWSLGNESQWGPHHAAMSAWLHEFDPTRPVQYESGNPPASVTDIMCPMYPALDWVESVMADASERRPMILCEYAYAKGNTSGNFDRYWELVEKYPSFQGGFIWEWHDAALIRILDNGNESWAWGNDLGENYPYTVVGEEPSQVLNGIVSPELEPHPGALEIKNIQAPIGLSHNGVLDAGAAQWEILVHNRYNFTALDGFELAWSVELEGDIQAKGTVSLPDLAPDTSGKLALSVPSRLAEKLSAGELFLNLRVLSKTKSAWAAAGHEIVHAQFAVKSAALPAWVPSRGTKLQISTEANAIVARGANGLSYSFSPEGLQQITLADGRNVLHSGIRENLYRAPLENDWVLGFDPSYRREWLALGLDNLTTTVLESLQETSFGGESFSFLCRKSITSKNGFECLWETRYQLDSAGTLDIENLIDVRATCDTLPRIGVRAEINAEFAQVNYYGRGPGENYPDRKSASMVGSWSFDALTERNPYIYAGENGARQDVRRLALLDSKGRGIEISGKPVFGFSALPWSQEALIATQHSDEVEANGLVNLCIDTAQLGVGGDNGWYKNVYPEYQVKPGIWRWGMRVAAV